MNTILKAPRKIAFITQGRFSHINAQVQSQLERQFPGYEIERLDLLPIVTSCFNGIGLRNVCEILRHYGPELLLRRNLTIRKRLYNTPYLFKRIRRLIHERFAGRAGEFAFSLQTQGLFDGHIEGVPHFVYTDHTHLANLGYPGVPHSELCSLDWVRLERQVYQHATRVFTMSSHVSQSLLDDYECEPEQIVCVYAGSNSTSVPTPLRNDGYSNKRILFVGLDWERKGGPILLRAFQKVLEQLPEARLIIIGCAPRIGLRNVTVLGKVPLPTVRTHLAEASVFCFPSRREPFGIAPIEAYTQRIPVVASNIGAMPEIIRHGESGYLVAPDDFDGFAKALLELLTDPAKCRRFGERGHGLVTERYSWDLVGVRLANAIHSALGSVQVVSATTV